MRGLELDLPLEDTASSRFMLWIVAGLTLLAVCAFAVAAVGDAAVRDFARRPVIVTVAIGAPPERAATAEKALLEHLRARPDVLFVEPVPEKELANLIDPWLASDGDGAPVLATPPRLVDVALRPEAVSALARLEAELREIEPDITVGAAAPPVLGSKIGRLVRALALAVGAGVLVAAVVVAAVVTRMSLDMHDETVDLLRLMGANDRYVARQFELHALAKGLRGAAIGFAAGVLGFLAAVELGRRFGGGIVQNVALRPLDWVVLAVVPVLVVLLVTLATRFAAARGLARLR
jgi:cell division transport system permease protein